MFFIRCVMNRDVNMDLLKDVHSMQKFKGMAKFQYRYYFRNCSDRSLPASFARTPVHLRVFVRLPNISNPYVSRHDEHGLKT